MELINQVCSYEQAVRLKQKGIKQDVAQFYFLEEKKRMVLKSRKDAKGFGLAAYTAAELGAMMPAMIISYRTYDGSWGCSQFDGVGGKVQENESMARAEYLIHLLDRAEVTKSQVNKNLCL